MIFDVIAAALLGLAVGLFASRRLIAPWRLPLADVRRLARAARMNRADLSAMRVGKGDRRLTPRPLDDFDFEGGTQP